MILLNTLKKAAVLTMEGINMTFDKQNSQVTIYIDDQPYQVSTDNNLLAGVLSQKLNLPYFCWHPSMGSVGACRQCAVTQYQDENDQRGRLVMACTTPVTDGMRISLKDSQSEQFREQVIAAMMTNHPHDCPVCAEGGECHLQDMTVMTGHTHRNYQGEKRTFNNQYLGEFVGHEMNRCITCYRCVRFYKDYAGGDDFGVYGSKNQVYFGRQQEGQLESEFSGNLVEVCPTGVFTNKLFSAHYARKWDLQSAPSICAHCSIGCNTSVGERYGSVRRVMNRYNQAINGYFLCDRGRFGIGFVNGEKRLRQASGIRQSSPERLSKLDVSKALVHFRGKRFIGVGSARASFEANYLLKQFVGNSKFSLGLTERQMQLASLHQQYLSQYQPVSIADIEQSDFVLIVDEDITQTAPRMALAVRQALRNASIEKASELGVPHWQDSAVRTIGGQELSPLYLIQSMGTKLDNVAEQVIMQSTAATIKLLNLMTELITSNAPLIDIHHQGQQLSSLLNQLVSAKKPLIIGGWSRQSPQLLSAIMSLLDVLTKADMPVRSAIVAQEVNQVGAISLLDQQSLSVEDILENVKQEQSSEVGGIIFLEQELSGVSQTQLEQLKQTQLAIIALDHSENAVTALADIVLPAASVTEGDGHYVNYQGLIQRYYQVHPNRLPIMDSWRWLTLLATTLFAEHPLAKEAQSLSQLHDDCRQYDAKWPMLPLDDHYDIARESHRTSGRTSKTANISVHEPKTTQSTDGYRFSMEGSKPSSTAEMPFTWAPGWNSNQSITQFQQEVAGSLLLPMTTQYLSIAQSIAKYCDHSEAVVQTSQANALQFSQQIKWYQGDWQAGLTPEFTLIESTNYIFLSSDYASQQGWQSGQWLQVSCMSSKDNAPTSVIAELFFDPRLSDELCYGQLNELATFDVKQVSLMAASEKQVADYKMRRKAEHTKAEQAQQYMLERLKQQDQFIPIRLMNGGLDDV